MIKADFEHWDRLLFRDYLIDHPPIANEYGRLKQKLSRQHPKNRVAYTEAKTAFIARITQTAKQNFKKQLSL